MADALTTRVRSALLERIQEGAWPAGARLPPERDLAVEYGCARGTLRRALNELAQDGTLRRQQGRGTFVGSPAPAGLTEALRALQQPVTPAEVMDLRLVVEPAAAGLTAARADAGQLAGLRQTLRESLAAEQGEPFEHWDAALHQGVVEAAGNPFLGRLFAVATAMRREERWMRAKLRAATRERQSAYGRQHSLLIESLSDRDATGAAAAMRAHLLAVQAALLGEVE